MIPDTEESRRVELYRAARFPDQWELENVLMDGLCAADATLFELDDRFWLFANQCPEGGSIEDELFLYHACAPTGPWTPHPRNPVVSDVTRARPGGTILRWGHEILRPSQDSSVRYGCYAIVLNRVEELFTQADRETPVSRIDASWQPGAIGTHTLSRSNTIEAIDWKVRISR